MGAAGLKRLQGAFHWCCGHVLNVQRGIERLQPAPPRSPRPYAAAGYVLAEMSVWQSRAYFLAKYGAITDNPEVGRELSETYWRVSCSWTYKDFSCCCCGESYCHPSPAKPVTYPSNQA